MHSANVGLQMVYINMRSVRRGVDGLIRAKGTKKHTSFIMDKFCSPNLLAGEYGYAHVLVVNNNGKVEHWNKFRSVG